MPKILSYLACGCAILENGSRIWCPTCEHNLQGIAMNQQVAEPQPYDLHAAIARLAEVEYECLSGLEHDYGTCAAGCEDGYIVPFRALRAECPGYNLLGVCAAKEEATRKWMGTYVSPAMTSTRPLTLEEREKYAEECGGECKGRGWIPEPDLERACWRVWKQLGDELSYWVGQALLKAGISGVTKEEAVIRAAEAWLEEQKP